MTGICILTITFISILLEFDSETKLYAVVLLLSVFSFIISILSIVHKPRKIFSPFWTALGSIGIQLFILIQFCYFFSRWISISFLWILVLLGLILYIILEVIKSEKQKLNLVQKYGIKLIENKRLIDAFKNESARIKDKLKALRILEKLSKDDKYGVKLALAKELEGFNQSKKYNWIMNIGSWILVLVIFILGASAEGLIQDLFNDKIKEFLCENIHVFCKKS